MLEQPAGRLQAFARLLDVPTRERELLLCRFEPFAKLCLLALKHVEGNRLRVGKVFLNDLLSLGKDVIDLFLAASDLMLSVADQPLELLDQSGFQLGDPLGVDLDLRFVVAGDEILNAVDRQVGKRAVLLLVSPRADEVVEPVAVPPGAFGEDQPPVRALLTASWRPRRRVSSSSCRTVSSPPPSACHRSACHRAISSCSG